MRISKKINMENKIKRIFLEDHSCFIKGLITGDDGCQNGLSCAECREKIWNSLAEFPLDRLTDEIVNCINEDEDDDD